MSTQCRPFDISREWSYLLFAEFFNQGDLEKHQNLPVSFLCDRDTTTIAKSQPGFVDFIVAPLFMTLAEVMPPLSDLVKQANENKEMWKTYEETEEDKLVYTKRKEIIMPDKQADPLSSECSSDIEESELTTMPPKLDIHIL